MKKRLLTILLTSLVMIGLMGVFLWKANGISQKISKNKEALLDEERDLETSKKAWEELNPLDVEELYLSGQKKNVVTREYDSIGKIYDVRQSAMAEELLTDLKKKGDYGTDRPLWAYNPYGTNPESLYLYFNAKGKCYCRYTISTDNDKVPDFTRTLSNGASGNVSKEHEYQLIGLVPGETNYIILKLYNHKNELSQTLAYKITMPKSYSGAQKILKSERGYSKVEIENGLYMVFQDSIPNRETVRETVTKKVRKKGRTVKKKVKREKTKTVYKSAILFYDNSGVLRGELPVLSDSGKNAEVIYDNLFYAFDKNAFAQVNSLGQVVSRIDTGSRQQYGEFAYDGGGSVYVLAEKAGGAKRKVPRGLRVLKMELSTGKVSEALNLADVLPASALKGVVGKQVLDSVQVAGTNQLLLGSSAMSSIFKVSGINSLMPKLDYIIADKKLWRDYRKLKKKVLTKTVAEGETQPPVETPLVDSILDTDEAKAPEPFVSQYGQNALVLDKEQAAAEGQYKLYLLNNNAGEGSAEGNQNSYYYCYLVDEGAGNYILSEKERLDKSRRGGNVTPFRESYLYCQSDFGSFLECDKEGKVVKSFQIKQNLSRVYKGDWKGFWFY